ncbi:hypothetical protein [Streptococcus loxodontisalivarius]|uniref:LXG domain-containing protein n=1 Tax=Streptococcus loxodontisalivarius TaxID=1349415 RepID=A0ABS2PSV2_9STRE|nr:hypothetical protein [Streptococcus loxodontisalivarius]MBM7643128.1 hypothetical protein [Streptococcus loxodontisalivarius]
MTRAATKLYDLSDLSKLRYLDEAVGFSDELMDANSLRKYAEGLEAAAQSAKVKMVEVLDDLTVNLKTTYGYAQETVDNVVDTIRGIELPTISPQYAYVAEGSEVTTVGEIIDSLSTPTRQTVLSEGSDLASVSSKLDEVVSSRQLYQSSDEIAGVADEVTGVIDNVTWEGTQWENHLDDLHQKMLANNTPVSSEVHTIDEIAQQQAEIYKVKSGESELITNSRKGNFGEMVQDEYYRQFGYDRISKDMVTGLEDAGHTGIDGVYYNPDG